MRVSAMSAVQRQYPLVSPAAVGHVGRCLKRIREVVDGGDTVAAGEQFARELDLYTGNPFELAQLGVREILIAMSSGQRAQTVATLARLGWAADGPEPDEATRYVIVGPALDASVWAATRLIDRARVCSVPVMGELYRLHGLDGDHLALVVLPSTTGPSCYLPRPLDDALRLLQAQGATVLPACWGAPDQPALDVRT